MRFIETLNQMFGDRFQGTLFMWILPSLVALGCMPFKSAIITSLILFLFIFVIIRISL